MEQFLYIRKSISNIQKALRVSSHAEPEILMISPGFIFRQEGTNELSAVSHSMKIIPQKVRLSNWFFYFTVFYHQSSHTSSAISHILFSQEISSVSICCLNCCAYSLRCHLKWHVMKCIILCTGCCRNCHKLLVCHFCDTKFF
mgnify:CR=1 FL=1